jgi:hypothetical protein
MNERVPDSSGLPLRAMVMVLLFLGIVFALVGLQAVRSSNASDDEGTTVPTVTTSATTPATAAAPPQNEPRPDVRVFNISDTAGVADRTATQLRDQGWNVTEVGNLTLPDVTATTVYFGTEAGEQAAAEEVGKILQAPVAPRAPEVADQPPGVIVVVTG